LGNDLADAVTMPSTAVPDAAGRVEEIRAFNRFYTNRIGVLRSGLHGSRHPLPEARVLFELGRREVTEVAQLRRDLDMDAGQLSRLLARLGEQGLVRPERSPGDGRRRRLRLTAAGRKAYTKLDRGSARQWAELLEHLDDAQQRRLLHAMATVRAVLEDPPAGDREVVLREPRAGDLGWIVERHGALYAAQYDWGAGFEALVARIVADFAAGHDPARERAWIAEVDGERAGCVLCVRRTDAVAALRLLLVEPAARGLGLGGRLVDACIAFARAAGYRELALWTNAPLVEARRIYDRRGFRLVSEAPHADWGVELVGQELMLDLAPAS
jgi:DNA-binding MarR family transcriptional regulator/N-acetylglutamate synthase-like GNAT family acetyltransferase